MIRFRRDSSDGGEHGCKGYCGKEVCGAAGRGGTRAIASADPQRKEPSEALVVVSRKPRMTPPVAAIFDGEKEAKLIALACSKPPKGRARWTLRLLENKVVELGIVERASDSTIGRTLKKTASSRIAGNAGSFRRRPTAPS